MMHPNGLELHDWGEYYIEGLGWIPIDQSFGRRDVALYKDVANFLASGVDAYRWIVNNDYSQPLYPAKIYPRSELEWKGGNLYFKQWSCDFDVEYVR